MIWIDTSLSELLVGQKQHVLSYLSLNVQSNRIVPDICLQDTENRHEIEFNVDKTNAKIPRPFFK